MSILLRIVRLLVLLVPLVVSVFVLIGMLALELVLTVLSEFMSQIDLLFVCMGLERIGYFKRNDHE